MEITYNIPEYDNEAQNAVEVVSLIDAKKQLRLMDDDSDPDFWEHEDSVIQSCINSAVSEAEKYMSRTLQPREMVFGLSEWEKNVVFPAGPVTEVTSVAYLKEGDTEYTTLDPDLWKLYNFGDNKDVLLIKQAGRTETLEPETLDAVKITATIGYEDGKIPEDIIKAVKLILTDAYEYRGEKEVKPNRSSRALLRPYKQWA